MTATRRLAAILAADVAGYSRLMGLTRKARSAASKCWRRELLDPKIAEHHGRIVKTTGDGVLVEFASVVDAVRCAALPAHHAALLSPSYLDLGAEFDDPVRRDTEEISRARRDAREAGIKALAPPCHPGT